MKETEHWARVAHKDKHYIEVRAVVAEAERKLRAGEPMNTAQSMEKAGHSAMGYGRCKCKHEHEQSTKTERQNHDRPRT